jgi:hypothetical protein
MKFSMTGQEKGDLLIHEAFFKWLYIYIYIYIHLKIKPNGVRIRFLSCQSGDLFKEVQFI